MSHRLFQLLRQNKLSVRTRFGELRAEGLAALVATGLVVAAVMALLG